MRDRFEITFDHDDGFFGKPENRLVLDLLEEMLGGLCTSLKMGHLPGVVIRLYDCIGSEAIFDPQSLGMMIRPIPDMSHRYLSVEVHIKLEYAQTSAQFTAFRHDAIGLSFMKGRPAVAVVSFLPELATAK